MHRLQAFWACAAALLLGAAPARGDEAPNPLTDRFQVTLGTFFISSRPTVQLNAASDRGDRVDWDKEFGGVGADRIRLDCHWRLAGRHKIRLTTFDVSRERSKVLAKNIDWGGEIYPVNAQVNADFSFAILEVAYEYAFLRRDNYELGASIGFHYVSLSASLDATAEASSGTLTEDLSGSARVDAPLPVIGIGGMWSLSHDLWLDVSAQFFVLTFDGYRGHLQNDRVSLTWQPKSWLGIGIGYSSFLMDLNVTNDDLHGAFDWSYRGPMVFYRASF